MIRSRYAQLGTLGGVALGAASLVIAVVSAGGGHGSYTPAKILFPYTMYLAAALVGNISPPLVALAFFEFPVYGFTVGMAAGRGKARWVVSSILILHAATSVLCLYVKSNAFGEFTRHIFASG
jgi:hypothetical protein